MCKEYYISGKHLGRLDNLHSFHQNIWDKFRLPYS